MTRKLEVINKCMPYTYHLYHIPTKKHYYGSRYAKGAIPSELGVSYFSSSKEVHALIEKYGKESFVYTVRQQFETPEEALLWETKLLNRIDAKNKPNWINQHNGDGKFSSYGEMPLHQRQQISQAKRGKSSRGSGWNHSNQTIEKIRLSNLGKNTGPISDNHKKNIGAGMKKALEKLSAEEKRQRVLNSCCSPESYTKERSLKISESLTGRKLSQEHRIKISEHQKKLAQSLDDDERAERYGKQNKGRTWKLVDGRRKWFDKGDIE